MKGVSEVAVVGLPDTEWGEAVTAFVVLKPDMQASEHDLVEHCRKLLADYEAKRATAGKPVTPDSRAIFRRCIHSLI